MRSLLARLGLVRPPDDIMSQFTIATPSGFSVEVLDLGEYEAPGEHEIRFQLSSPVEGQSLFRSINGTGFYDACLDRVFIYDSNLILEVDPKSFECRHKNAHHPFGFQSFARNGDRLRFAYLCQGEEPKAEDVRYVAIFWHVGLGYASRGRFPSAPITRHQHS